ncbi:MAG: beta-ketoacyl synthase N-terminal-like domain-containing protein, partial [Dehalococcoidia bacterium]|nr:beta-ketoacyl synthase N-terminal-like domain-containing protein [Dehalococcoidia bacterium]
MKGIRDRVAVVGMGCTHFGELWSKSADDLMVDASVEAFADAGIEAKQIQAAWVGTYQSFRTGVGLAYPLKLQYVPVTRVENACATGTDAFRNACYAVAAGVYDYVLAVGVEKQKDSGYAGLVANAEVISSETAPQVPAPTQFALAATRYFHTFGLSFQEGKQM